VVSNIDRASGRTDKWTEDELIKLKDAAQTHGGKNWKNIAALVPGRTDKQYSDRWRDMKPTCNTVRRQARGTLKKAPLSLGQDPQLP
jgi:hypothetical protein